MYKVPAAVKKVAEKGLHYNQFIRCNNAIGVRRAKQLINNTTVSKVTIKKMYSYLSRAAEYYTNDSKKCGTVSYWLWGGKAGYNWSKKIINEK
jgi:hypothetical protein